MRVAELLKLVDVENTPRRNGAHPPRLGRGGAKVLPVRSSAARSTACSGRAAHRRRARPAAAHIGPAGAVRPSKEDARTGADVSDVELGRPAVGEAPAAVLGAERARRLNLGSHEGGAAG